MAPEVLTRNTAVLLLIEALRKKYVNTRITGVLQSSPTFAILPQ